MRSSALCFNKAAFQVRSWAKCCFTLAAADFRVVWEAMSSSCCETLAGRKVPYKQYRVFMINKKSKHLYKICANIGFGCQPIGGNGAPHRVLLESSRMGCKIMRIWCDSWPQVDKPKQWVSVTVRGSSKSFQADAQNKQNRKRP